MFNPTWRLAWGFNRPDIRCVSLPIPPSRIWFGRADCVFSAGTRSTSGWGYKGRHYLAQFREKSASVYSLFYTGDAALAGTDHGGSLECLPGSRGYHLLAVGRHRSSYCRETGYSILLGPAATAEPHALNVVRWRRAARMAAFPGADQRVEFFYRRAGILAAVSHADQQVAAGARHDADVLVRAVSTNGKSAPAYPLRLQPVGRPRNRPTGATGCTSVVTGFWIACRSGSHRPVWSTSSRPACRRLRLGSAA